MRGLEGALHNQIDLNPQQIGKPNLNADDVEKRKKLCLVQCGQQVDIGAGTGISSGVEPNSDKCAAPASRSSFSCARSVVSTCSLFIIDSCPARASGQGWLTPESLGQSKGYSAPSISFHKNVTESILSERIEILPAVDDGSSVDFLNTLSYSGFKFSQGLDSDMPKEASRHLAKQGFDNV